MRYSQEQEFLILRSEVQGIISIAGYKSFMKSGAGNLYARLYEDLAKGLLTESRFKMLAEKYDREQAELNEAIHSIDRTREQEQDQLSDIRQFVTEVGGYAGITELNYSIIHKLIDKIYIFQAEEVDGEKIQRLKICYKFVGSLEEKPE